MFQSYKSQRWTALIQSWFSVKQRWIFQFWTALIQIKSELISFGTELISADFLHVFWISAQKRQISETALFSVDYLWDFNSGISLCRKWDVYLSFSSIRNFCFFIISLFTKHIYCNRCAVKRLTRHPVTTRNFPPSNFVKNAFYRKLSEKKWISLIPLTRNLHLCFQVIKHYFGEKKSI